MIPIAAEIDEQEWLKAAASSPAFELLADPGEDIYSLADGKPFIDEGVAVGERSRRERGAW
jgi:hypothetical protein